MNAEEFDTRLKIALVVNKEMLDSLDYAYNYEEASSINWLKQRIEIIRGPIEQGTSIKIEEAPSIKLNTVNDLRDWINLRYTEVASDIF